jgi:hypothetical protein
MSMVEEYKREAEQLQMFLSEIGDLLERTSGFVQRNSKFGGNELVQVMSLGCLENGKASLDTFVQVAQDLGISISSSGLHQRLTMEAVSLLAQVCQLWMQQNQPNDLREVLTAFKAVRIFDSSQIRLASNLAQQFAGTRNGAVLKVQLVYEYRQGRIEALEIEAGCAPDQNCDLPQQLSAEGDLCLFDLGYFDQQTVADLDAAGCYFLSRLQSQVGLYEASTDKVKLDVLAQVNQLPKTQMRGEQTLYLGSQRKVPVRFIYYRLPPEVVQERRRKAKQAAHKAGKTLTAHALAWLDWAFFVTNVPQAILSVEQVAIVYRVRWQIELLFKVWKQEMDWGVMANWRLERVLVQFYARCLALLIFHRFLEKYQAEAEWEICWQKSFRLFKRRCAKLITIVRANFRGILAFLRRLDQTLRRFAPKTKRRKDPSTYSLLQLVRA